MMTGAPKPWPRWLALWSDNRATQIAEFALSLPLLVLFVIGIFDFSSALTLKQKLTNAAREGARVAAADPANDLASPSTPVPASVSDAYQVVDNYLLSESINDCGLSGAGPPIPANLKWIYTSTGSGCAPAGITVEINRKCQSVAASTSGTVNLIGTCVTITYAYKWQFSNVASLLGWTGTLPTSLTAYAGAFNEN